MLHKFLYWLPLLLIMGACAGLLTAWVFVVPIFESPDEPQHWLNVEYIHSTLKLPPYTGEYSEGVQPPVYYALMAPVAARTELPRSLAKMVNGKIELLCTPHLFESCPGDVHRYWPIRRVRLASALLALVGIWFTALTALEITQSMSCAVIAAAFIGFLPQFDFRGATVNNDTGAAAFSAIAIYFVMRIVRRGFQKGVAASAAVAIALAFLSKINTAILLPVFIVSILVTAPDWRTRLKRLIFPIVSGLLVLPWILRNKLIYGELLPSSEITRVLPALVSPHRFTDEYFYVTLPSATWRSFIGFFGWMNVPMPEFIYREYAVLLSLALLGLMLLVLVRRKHRRIVTLLAILPISSLALLLQLNLTFEQPQGRLLFPSLPAVAVLTALGLGVVHVTRRHVAVLVAVGCFATNVYALDKVVYASYWNESLGTPLLQDVLVLDTLMKGKPPGPLLSGHRFTQSFLCSRKGLSTVDVEIGPYGHPSNGSLTMSLSESRDGQPIAQTVIPVTRLNTCCAYARLGFPPLADSAKKLYFVTLSSNGLALPEGITVFLSGTNVYPGGEFFVDGKPTGQDTSFRTFVGSENRACSHCTP